MNFVRPILFSFVCIATTRFGVAADDNAVNVYTTRQPYLVEPIFEEFTKETGISVNTVFADKGILERIQLEGSSSPADILIEANVQQLAKATSDGLTQAVNSEDLITVIPANLRDKDNQWFALTTRARVITTSKERVEEGVINSYADLADPKWAGSICTRSGKHPYMVALIASQIAHNGLESTRTWLEGVKNNLARKPQGNDRAQVKAVHAGECDIALINTYYMGVMLSDPEQSPAAESVRIIFPDQESNGTHVNISAMAMLKHAPHYDNAVQLMNFMVGDMAQQMYAEGNFEYPVRADVPLSPIVAQWGEFKSDTLSLNEISEHIDEATRLVDEVGYDL